MKIKIARVNENINNFTVKEGFVMFTSSDDKIFGITSGWNDGHLLYVYTYQDGEWIGGWEDDENFPVGEALEAIEMYEKENEMKELEIEVAQLLEDGVELYISSEPIRFTDEVAGERSSDGGEYGFYSTYYPTDVVGIYEYYTSTTCEFDACGTGYEGLSILTQGKYEYLVGEEEKVLRANN